MLGAVLKTDKMNRQNAPKVSPENSHLWRCLLQILGKSMKQFYICFWKLH